MHIRTMTSYAAITAATAVALTGCSAFANRDARQAASHATATTVAAPRTEATTPAPNPPPVDPDLVPVGPVSFALEEKGDLGTILVDGTGYTVYAFDREPENTPV